MGIPHRNFPDRLAFPEKRDFFPPPLLHMWGVEFLLPKLLPLPNYLQLIGLDTLLFPS